MIRPLARRAPALERCPCDPCALSRDQATPDLRRAYAGYLPGRGQGGGGGAPRSDSPTEALHTAFRASLATTYSTRTVAKHADAVQLCIHFLCEYTNVEQLEAVTRGMVNSPFRRW